MIPRMHLMSLVRDLTPSQDVTRYPASKIPDIEMRIPLTVEEVAKQLRYHPDLSRQLLRTGKVKGERIVQMWLIDHQEIERIKALQGSGGRLPKEPKRSWLSLSAEV